MLGHPLSTLSTELIDEIVDWVALSGSKNDLHNLLAIDRAFGGRCRTSLFKTLPLIVEDPEGLEACWSMIKGNPSIARYVCELHLLRIESYSPVKRDIWSGDDPCFDNIIQALGATSQPPTSLKVSGRVDIPASFERWAAASFFSTTLARLDLSSVENFPLSTIRYLRNLRFLNLYMAGVVNEEGPGMALLTARAPHPPQLEELTFRMSGRAAHLLVEASHPDFQYAGLATLRVLRFHVRRMPEMAFLQAILNKSSSALEELQIHQHYSHTASTCLSSIWNGSTE
jgi:hypothetical protein